MLIGIILIHVCTKNTNVTYVTNVDTRKTFVAFWKLNLPSLFQSQSKENPLTSHIISEQIHIWCQRFSELNLNPIESTLVSVNKIQVCFQYDTASDIILISHQTY